MPALIGVVVAYSVVTIAGRITSARVIGTLFSIDPAMGSLIGLVMLGEHLSVTAIFGVVLVAVSGATTGLALRARFHTCDWAFCASTARGRLNNAMTS